MRRWHLDAKVARRERDRHARTHVLANMYNAHNRVGRSAYEIDCPCDTQVGRFRKKDAFDCGRPHCGVCHFDKYYSKRARARRKRETQAAVAEQRDG